MNPTIKVVNGSLGEKFLLVTRDESAELGVYRDLGPDKSPLERYEWSNRNFTVDLYKPGFGRVTLAGGEVMAEVNWGGSGAKSAEDTLLFANLLATAARIAAEWDFDVREAAAVEAAAKEAGVI